MMKNKITVSGKRNGIILVFLALIIAASLTSVGIQSNENSDIVEVSTEWVEDYDGMVYDVTVQNHILFVRRNNKTAWSGNCGDDGFSPSSGTVEGWFKLNSPRENSTIFSAPQEGPATSGKLVLSMDFDGPYETTSGLVGWWRFDNDTRVRECYDNETEILTDEGWKHFWELDKTEKVATLNPETGETEFHRPWRYQNYKFDGDMYRIETEQGDLVVSPEHKVFGKLSPVSPVVMPESLELNDVSLDCENENKASDTDPLVFAHIIFRPYVERNHVPKERHLPEVLEVLDLSGGERSNLLDLLLNSPEKNRVILLELGKNPTNLRSIGSHNSSHHLSNSSRVMGLPEGSFSASFNSLMNSSLTSISSKGSQPVLSQNSSSFSVSSPAINLSNISLFMVFSLATSDQFTQGNLLSAENSLSSSEKVMLTNQITPFLSSSSNFCNLASFSSTPSLATSGQLTSGIASSFSFNSLDIDTVNLFIFNPSCIDRRRCVNIYGDFELKKDFGLMPVTKAYELVKEGREVLFMDGDGKEIRIKSIEKVPYSGRIYDVTVDNHIILVRRDNLVVWSGNSYNASENFTVHDYSGQGNNGVFRNNGTGGLRWNSTGGKFGGGFDFDGIDDLVNVSDSASLDGMTDLTVEAWFKGTFSASSLHSVVSKFVNGQATSSSYYIQANYGRLRGLVYDSDQDMLLVSGSTNLSNNTWHHVAWTFDGSTGKGTLYLNGRVDNTSTDASVSDVQDTTENVIIGACDSGTARFFNGTIDEVRIYNRALSTAEINWSSGVMVQDLSGEGNDGLSRGNISYNYYSIFGGAFEFDGEGHIDCRNDSSLLITESLTVGAWVRPDSNGWTRKRPIRITNNANSNLTEYQIKLVMNTTNLVSGGAVQSDYDDIRFYNSTGSKLDYWLRNYTQDNITAWVQVPNIPASSTETIYMYYGNPSASPESNINTTFSYSTPQEIYYVLSNHTLTNYFNVTSYLDGNTIKDGTTTLSLDRGEVGTLAVAGINQNTSINVTRPIAGRLNSTDGGETPVPISWAGRYFAYSPSRYDPDIWCIRSPFGTANVSIYKSSDPSPTISFLVYEENRTVCKSATIADGYPFIIEANISVIALYYTSGYGAGYEGSDVIALYPMSLELYGVAARGTTGYPPIVALNDGTTVTVYCSDGTNATYSIDRGSNQSTSCTIGSQGTGDAMHLVADKPVMVNSQADGDGVESFEFLPPEELMEEYILPTAGQYISIACPYNSTNVTVYNPDGSVYKSNVSNSSYSEFNPRKLYFGSSSSVVFSAGTRVVADKPIFAYYEHYTHDETNLLSYIQARKYVYPEPSYSVDDETAAAGVSKAGAYGIGANTTTAFASINNRTISGGISSGWNYIALTYDNTGSSQQRLYINGRLSAQGNSTGTINTNPNSLTIGDYLNGSIDSVRVYNRTLSAEEIKGAYLGLSLFKHDDTLVFHSGNATITKEIEWNSSEWHFIAGTYDNSSATVRLYLDGAKVGETKFREGGSFNQSYIGSDWRNSSSYTMNGSIDELRILNKSLTASEVSEDYQRGVADLYLKARSGSYYKNFDQFKVLSMHMDPDPENQSRMLDSSSYNNDGTLTNVTFMDGYLGVGAKFTHGYIYINMSGT